MTNKKLKEKALNLSKLAFKNEQDCVNEIIDFITFDHSSLRATQDTAKKYAQVIRNNKSSYIENFLQEFSLSTEEGVAIMCLAESLLRIPDRATSMALIEDKLKNKNWSQHLYNSHSYFINASAWALLLTGKVSEWASSKFSIKKSLNKLSRPIILKAIKRAIKIMSNTYILGDDLNSALKNSKKVISKGYKISFDILGESARTADQANFYYHEYIKAIESIDKYSCKNSPIYSNHNLSVKLTALHPKVLYKKITLLEQALLPKLKHIISLCQNANISISFDAEEAYRQDTYLEILTKLILDPDFKNFDGIGLVIQSYQKRTFQIIDYLADLAKLSNKRIPIRLVKGAYWDGEIKLAQEFGLEGYPVFTKKEYTDISYIACAQKIFNYDKLFYPQFATHNAQTAATIITLANNKEFEFQRLQGMGTSLHDKLLEDGYASRIYAPVGKYEELLAYLMRRLLENGSNNSFVNLISDRDNDLSTLVLNPIIKSKLSVNEDVSIALPKNIYQGLRSNSLGYDIGYRYQFEEILANIESFKESHYQAYSIIGGKELISPKLQYVRNPANDKDIIGEIYLSDDKAIKSSIDIAQGAFLNWSNHNASHRSKILRKIGELLHKNRYQLYYLLIKESGKNIDDCIAEVREAIDFAEYYATLAERIIDFPIKLPGYTGETNQLSWHAKGIFVCISPWNFPLAIFTGQILAALVTGNTVLAKPAGNTSLIATFAAKLFYQAGLPHDVFQLLIAKGNQMTDLVLIDPRIKGVCFTGSTPVALRINRTLAMRDAPIATVIAETGGQNAMIVDSSALLEQAADSIIYSSFGSIGQRCSALRVLYIQNEIADKLIELLKGHMDELVIGNTLNFESDLGPVIDKNSKDELHLHIKSLPKIKGCSLIARHRQYHDINLASGNFVVPHIFAINKITDLEKENFGPILHIIKYDINDLDKVIEDINQTGYGLTFGIQTRIEERIQQISSKMHVGNIYANRTTIGAQVGTHPFGGENNSGTGFKAGGPHYLYKFMNERVLTINTTAIGGNLDLLKSQ